MFNTYKLFSKEKAAEILRDIKSLDWQQGLARTKESTGTVKKNLELKAEHGEILARHLQFIHQSIAKNKDIQRDMITKRILFPKFNHYKEGGTYNKHSDGAFMGPDSVRTDLSCTVFLTPPDEYEGGELNIERSIGETLTVSNANPGMCVLYPTKDLHWVNPVTKGSRISAVTWLESHIRDEFERDLLTRFRRVLFDMEADENLAWGEHFTTLTMIQSNLLKKWVD